MTDDPARVAAVAAALQHVEAGMTVGLGSGRATFAFATALGNKWAGEVPVRAVVASRITEKFARDAGVPIVDLDEAGSVDMAFDGADEVDPELAMIKGGGAALLREKLVIAAADHVVIMVEEPKQVDRLGSTRLLPVEIIRFGWKSTQRRVQAISGEATLRLADDGAPVITDEGHYLLDVPIPPGNVRDFGDRLKAVLGAVDHGLFFDVADLVIVGHSDGSLTTLSKAVPIS